MVRFDAWLVQQHAVVQRLGAGDLLASIFAWKQSAIQTLTMAVYVLIAHVAVPAHIFSGRSARPVLSSVPALTSGLFAVFAALCITLMWPGESIKGLEMR